MEQHDEIKKYEILQLAQVLCIFNKSTETRVITKERKPKKAQKMEWPKSMCLFEL